MYDFITIKDYGSETPHTYIHKDKDGYYTLKGKEFLSLKIKELFEHNDTPWRKHDENEILSYMDSLNIIDRDNLKPQKNLINVGNGIFNLETKILEKHDPSKYFLYKIPINYKENAKFKGSKIEKYILSTFDEKYIAFVKQLFGYCLYANVPTAMITYLYGEGGGGKSVFISTLYSFLGGKRNVTAIELSDFVNNRFATANLYGKLANVSGELSGTALTKSDMLKKISSGDITQAEFKNKNSFGFEPYAKIITACNQIPACDDPTTAWTDRQFVLPFLKKFRNTSKEIKELDIKLNTKKEMEALLLWAIEGLIDLKNKKWVFSYPNEKGELNDPEANGKAYRKYRDSLENFIFEALEYTTNADKKTNKEIYAHYKGWCYQNDQIPQSMDALGKALHKTGRNSVSLRSEKTGKPIRGYNYTKLYPIENLKQQEVKKKIAKSREISPTTLC